MSLSSFNRMGVLNHQIPEYEEYGWVCAPNEAGQAIATNTLTTLTINQRVSPGSFGGSVGSNQITLPAGTYVFEAFVPTVDTAGVYQGYIFGLRKDPSGTPSFVTRKAVAGYANSVCDKPFTGHFTINTTTTFDLTILGIVGSGAIQVRSGFYNTQFTDSTAGNDQRTTLKLWRYKETITQSQVKIGGGNSWSSYAELRNMVALNVAGQAISADTMTTVQLTEKTTDPDGIVTLAANQFVLGTGTYYVEVEGTSVLTGGTGVIAPIYYRVQNITDGSIAIIPATGTQSSSAATPVHNASATPMESFNGVLVFTGSKTFELQVCCDVGGNLGSAISATLNTPSSNCLARVKIYKR